MNMFRSLFFIAVATVVVGGNESAAFNGQNVLKKIENPAIAVPVFIAVSKSKHLNNNTKDALAAAAVSSVVGDDAPTVATTFVISKAIGEAVDTSYGKRVVSILPAKEYTETYAWLKWIGKIFVSVYLGDKIGSKISADKMKKYTSQHTPTKSSSVE